MAAQAAKRLFNFREYYRMAEAGIISEDDRVELIEGEIVEMSPIGTRHSACLDRFIALLGPQVSGKAILRVQNPIHLSDYTEPQPDVSLLKPRADFYAHQHPRPADALIVIEVADTSLDYDQKVKAVLYAQAGIAEYWLVDLNNDVVIIYTQPVNGHYQQSQQFGHGDSLTSAAMPGLALAVIDILGS
jgi:Uma2 family endonuclease